MDTHTRIKLPVSDHEKWSVVVDDLETCLSFLPGDVWTIRFIKRECELYRPNRGKVRAGMCHHVLLVMLLVFSQGT